MKKQNLGTQLMFLCSLVWFRQMYICYFKYGSEREIKWYTDILINNKIYFTFVSIPKIIAKSNSKVFVTSSPATILEGLADIVLLVVDSGSKILLFKL